MRAPVPAPPPGPRGPVILALAVLAVLLVALAPACDGGGGADPGGSGDAGADAAIADAPGADGDASDGTDDDAGPPPELVIPEVQDLARWVDPMIGTGGPGNVIPGALVPHGMVRVSPDTDNGPTAVDAYDYANAHVEGFTHLHLEGPGGGYNGYSHILLMPALGPPATAVEQWRSAFSHDTEEAEPGYYAVTLDTWGVRAEVTAGPRAAVHRWTFPASDEAAVAVDVGRSLGLSKGGHLEAAGDRGLRGWGTYNVHPGLELLIGSQPPTGQVTVYFHLELDRPFDGLTFRRGAQTLGAAPDVTEADGAWLGAWLGFATAEGDRVVARVGISLIGMDEARANLEEDVGDRTFEEVRAAAREAWNLRLNRVQITGDDTLKTLFYTALYRSMFQPADYTEAGGRFLTAAAGVPEVFEADGWRYHTDDWCMWDTYRTSHPLRTLTEPEMYGDIVRSMLHLYQQGGWLPKCTWNASGYSRVMIGVHALPIIVDGFVKGLRDFDADLAWEAMWKATHEDVDNPGEDGACGILSLGTPPEYLSLGYVPTECDPMQAASMTLEHAYDDWTLARFAEATGREAARAELDARAESWRQHWDPVTGFMRGKRRDGTWTEPFDPADTSDNNDFVEASAWIFTFFVPHDAPALREALGGPAALRAKLDAFFDGGHFDPSNQPSFHIPWLYNWTGEPYRTQARVREVLTTRYGTGPGGLPGNDDAGAMSAWLVWGALGLYPVAPGATTYEIGSPLVERAVLHLHPRYYPGGTFAIETVGGGADRPYVQSAELNGAPLDRPWLTHEDLAAGGVLRITLGAEPSGWGASR